MRILELTNFSAGGCGVFARVKSESDLLSKNHEVRIFSSNFVKGSEEIASPTEKIGKVLIKRFSGIRLGGESFMYWDFEKEALHFKPHVIIAHGYRHIHTTKALRVAKKCGAKVLLVTHAPFVKDNTTRSFIQKLAVNFYDKFIGRRTINKFDKIISIAKWEQPYLRLLGLKKEKLEYIPNGIPSEFFTQKRDKSKNKIIFFGRISPIKDIETLIKAFSIIDNKEANLEIIGPAEKDYLQKLMELAQNSAKKEKIIFSGPVYEVSKKIRVLDSAEIFILPSKKEGMPQALIEAMAREKIVIASNSEGAQEIIKDGINGYLFKIGDVSQLADTINKSFNTNSVKIKKAARKTVEKFSWNNILKKIELLIYQITR